jgi:hypothetical protein
VDATVRETTRSSSLGLVGAGSVSIRDRRGDRAAALSTKQAAVSARWPRPGRDASDVSSSASGAATTRRLDAADRRPRGPRAARPIASLMAMRRPRPRGRVGRDPRQLAQRARARGDPAQAAGDQHHREGLRRARPGRGARRRAGPAAGRGTPGRRRSDRLGGRRGRRRRTRRPTMSTLPSAASTAKVERVTGRGRRVVREEEPPASSTSNPGVCFHGLSEPVSVCRHSRGCATLFSSGAPHGRPDLSTLPRKSRSLHLDFVGCLVSSLRARRALQTSGSSP